MNTPITKKLWTAQDDESFVEHTARIKDGMSRLETDRAALMKALDAIFRASSGGCSPEASEEFCDIVLDLSEFALTAARANFPTP